MANPDAPPPPHSRFRRRPSTSPGATVGANGTVMLTPMSIEFLQLLWASIQGGGGVIDLNIAALINYGTIAAQTEGLIAQDARAQVGAGLLAGEIARLGARISDAEMLALALGARPPTPPSTEVSTVLVASENIAAGAAVQVWNNAGAYNLRNADTTSAIATPKDCNGFARAAIASAAAGRVDFLGQVAGAGLTAGPVWLGAAGAVSSTPNTTAGQIVQQVGIAISATAWIFQPQAAVGT
jgi:hypothetical protein